MITIGVIAGVIVAFGAVISGVISVGRWIYHRGEEAQREREERARLASYIAAQENRDRNQGDENSAPKRGLPGSRQSQWGVTAGPLVTLRRRWCLVSWRGGSRTCGSRRRGPPRDRRPRGAAGRGGPVRGCGDRAADGVLQFWTAARRAGAVA
jgi:hypothetical protein